MSDHAKFNPNIHHRKSIRLGGYDYSNEGVYFITVNCHNRKCLFGKIENRLMILNDAGEVAKNCWMEIPDHFPHAILHEFIIMPNHIHGIIELTVGANNHSPWAKNFSPQPPQPPRQPFRSPSRTTGSIVRGFKIGVTKWIRSNTNIHNVWQRDYYEHIIRDDASYQRITNYIINNPAKWKS